MHVIAAKAVAFKEAQQESFAVYQKNIVDNAKALAEHLTSEGVDLVSGGTDNHMMLADLTNLNITGKDAEALLGRAGITANKNTIPFDTESPFVTSGIRLGTPTLTSRGWAFDEMEVIAKLVVAVLKNNKDENIIKETGKKVRELCEAFPIYSGLEV